MDYIQLLFSFFNAPLFATFIIGMFWKRTSPAGGICGIVAGTLAAVAAHYANSWGWVDLGSDQAAAFWGAIGGVRRRRDRDGRASRWSRKPKPIEELQGLVYGMANDPGREPRSERVWYRRPQLLAGGVLAMTAGLSFMFI